MKKNIKKSATTSLLEALKFSFGMSLLAMFGFISGFGFKYELIDYVTRFSLFILGFALFYYVLMLIVHWLD